MGRGPLHQVRPKPGKGGGELLPPLYPTEACQPLPFMSALKHLVALQQLMLKSLPWPCREESSV